MGANAKNNRQDELALNRRRSSMPIRFRVNGTPKPQPRPRAFARKVGKKIITRMHEAGTAEAWKSDVIRCGHDFKPRVPLEGPLRVDITFYMPRPKKWMRKKDSEGPIWAPTRPDRDNLDKAVLDALQTDGWFRDDGQVVAGEVRKMYHAKDDTCGAVIVIQRINTGT